MHSVTFHGGGAGIHLLLTVLLLDTGVAGLFCILKQGSFGLLYLLSQPQVP